MNPYVHEFLPSGLEFGLVRLPQRHVVSFQIRFMAGTSEEPSDKLGLARLVEDTIDKGTERRTGRELLDAFDAIGAGCGSGCGRETTTFTCTVLPEHFEQALALHAEFLRTPTFPQDAFEVNVALAKQELVALEDDAQGLVDKHISLQAFGPILGRHPIGEAETLDRTARSDVESFWRSCYQAGRMVFSAAGPLDPHQVTDLLHKHFEGFGSSGRNGREPHPFRFTPQMSHYHKDLQQQQISICWPGVDATHEDFPVQRVALGILSGGMSGRLFTEVREKRGLAYWVSAWQDMPRGSGMLFLGASTTPERCEQTYTTLLREVDRLSEDLVQEELDRAVTGIAAGQETKGDTTRSRCGELCNDLFFFGRPVPVEEKIAKIEAVTVNDVRRFLDTYPRDRLCVITMGPKPLFDNGSENG
ncbi:MAG: insulinase family protein [Planctomycetes bacterium]|nr:insulinase family protein [Planctomycetota bacterium]